MGEIETFVNEDKLYILWRTKVTNFRKVMKLSQITVLELEQFFWNFVRIIICKKSPQYLTFLHFKASDIVVPIRPGDTSNVEETSYFTAGFAFHKMFKSVARFVNAATKKTRDKVGIFCILCRVWNFVMSLVWYNDHRPFVRIFFLKLWQKEYFLESSAYIKPSKYDNIYVLIEWWNFVRSQ